MSVKVWKKENSLKPEKIWPPLRRIMRKSVLTPPKVKPKKRKLADQIFSFKERDICLVMFWFMFVFELHLVNLNFLSFIL